MVATTPNRATRRLVIAAIVLACASITLFVIAIVLPNRGTLYTLTGLGTSDQPAPTSTQADSAQVSTTDASTEATSSVSATPESSAPSEETAPATSPAATAEPEPAPTSSAEDQAIASLDGWWAGVGGQYTDASGIPRYRSVIHVEGGEWQLYDSYGKAGNTGNISPDSVERLDLLGTSGWYFHDLGLYLSDEQPDTLHRINADGSNYSGTGSFGRLDGEPQW